MLNGLSDPDARAWPVLAAIVALAITAAHFALVAPVPFLSEDWTHLALARSIASLADAMSLEREPLRPFQHGFFWLLARSGLDPAAANAAALARIPAFVLHLGSCAAVFVLARAFGARSRGAALACVLFALAPNVKSLAWPAAIGSPGRVCFELAALAAFAWHARERRFLYGVFGLVCFALALGFHESALLTPLVFALWLVAGDERGWRAGLWNYMRALRDPFLLAFTFGGVVHALQLATRPQRHHDWKSFDALPANVAKAALALVPEPLRAGAIEGLRGGQGTLGLVLGGLAVLLVVAACVFALRRGGPARFVALAVAADLVLAVLGAGFVQRYAYFASGLLALALALAWERRPRGTLALAAPLLAVAWGIDALVDAFDLRAAGRIAHTVVDEARSARATMGPVPIALVDLPDMAGREEDVPLFNWGADEMLAAHGVAGPWLLWRTRAFRTRTSFELVDAECLTHAAAEGSPRLLIFDAGSGAMLRK